MAVEGIIGYPNPAVYYRGASPLSKSRCFVEASPGCGDVQQKDQGWQPLVFWLLRLRKLLNNINMKKRVGVYIYIINYIKLLEGGLCPRVQQI